MQRTQNVKLIEQNTMRELILPTFHTQPKARIVTREHYWCEGEHGTDPTGCEGERGIGPQDARVSMALVPQDGESS